VDAQLATTVWLQYEYQQAMGDRVGAQETLAEWKRLRTAVLGKLRGTRRTSDTMTYGTDDTTGVVIRLTNTLPPETVVNGKDGMVWLSFLTPTSEDVFAKAQAATGVDGWRRPYLEEVLKLVGTSRGNSPEEGFRNIGLPTVPQMTFPLQSYGVKVDCSGLGSVCVGTNLYELLDYDYSVRGWKSRYYRINGTTRIAFRPSADREISY
jgi:hypothetical protein